MPVSRRDFLKGSALALGAGSLSTFAMSQERSMSAFDKEYFFLLQPHDESLPSLTASPDTAKKRYTYEAQPVGAKPFIFYNGFYDMQKASGIAPTNPPPDVMFSGSDLVVCTRIAEKLMDLEIPNLAIQPSIYIDHKKKWHENYWYLTFLKLFDCWDREHSTYKPKAVYKNPATYNVYAYSLNDQLLNDTPLAARRLFKMGGTMFGNVVAHKSVVDLFRVKGVTVISVADYDFRKPRD